MQSARKKAVKTCSSLLLVIIILFSTMLPAFAWTDFTQSKTNVFRGTAGKASVVLYKNEKDAQGNIVLQPVTGAEFYLYKKDGNVATQIGGRYTTNSKGQVEVHDLTEGDYYFEETNPSYGYVYDKDEHGKEIRQYPFVVTEENAVAGVVIEVEAYNRRMQSSLEISKKIEVAPGQILPESQANREFEFTVTFSDGGNYQYRINGGAPQELKEKKLYLKDGQTARFIGLPVGVQYTIVETPVIFFTTSSTNSQGHIQADVTSHAGFVNYYDTTIHENDTKITVTKKVEGVIPEADKDKEFWFTLSVEGDAPIRFSLKNGESKTFTIPAGKHYSIVEDDYFDDGYILKAVINGTGTTTGTTLQVLVTNKYIGETLVEIEGEKTWDLTHAPAGTALPESITLHLINKETKQVVGVKTVLADEKGKWKYTFAVPKFESSGKEIVYIIKEQPIDGYITTVTGMNVKNTYIKPIAVDVPVAEKIVTGDKGAPRTTFTFKLKGHANAPMPDRSVNGEKTIEIGGSGEKNFGTIVFAKPGTYAYSITEVKGDVDGFTYDTTVYHLEIVIGEKDGKLYKVSQKLTGGTLGDKIQFTNNYKTPTPLGETIELKGTKTWFHGKNPIENRPAGIYIHIKNGDKTIATEYVSDKELWSWHFVLPKFDVDGKEIKYTVDEDPVKDYTKKIDGYDIANFHKSVNPDDPIEPVPAGYVAVSGTKTWDHGTIDKGFQPTSVTVYVKNGDEIVETKEVDANNNWSYTFVLPEKDSKGNIIQYKVGEENVKYYTASVDGYNITNTFRTMGYSGDNPPTGDTLQIGLLVTIGALSLALMGSIMYAQKKQKKRKNKFGR